MGVNQKFCVKGHSIGAVYGDIDDRLEYALKTGEQNQLTVKSIVWWPWIVNALLN